MCEYARQMRQIDPCESDFLAVFANSERRAVCRGVSARSTPYTRSIMLPRPAILRSSIVALAMAGFLVSPPMGRMDAGCHLSRKVTAAHRDGCCCGDRCHCAHCPGASSGSHSPQPTPAAPEDGRAVAKVTSQADLVIVAFVTLPRFAAFHDASEWLVRSVDSSLLAQHTCLRA